jgi:Fic family protein
MASTHRPKSAKGPLETVGRFEPALLDQLAPPITDLIADISATSATLGRALHPKTAANLAGLIRLMNTYYSNLIEGHNTRPRDIERALEGHFDTDRARRNLQLEATAHVRVQEQIDQMATEGRLPEPTSREFISWLHREFYKDAPRKCLPFALRKQSGLTHSWRHLKNAIARIKWEQRRESWRLVLPTTGSISFTLSWMEMGAYPD